CPAGRERRPCKHAQALRTLGLLDPADWRRAFDAFLTAEAARSAAEAEAARWADVAREKAPAPEAAANAYALPRGVAPGCEAFYGKAGTKAAGTVRCRIVKIVGERAQVVMDGKRRPEWVSLYNLAPF